ncbi:MAG: tRNA threonylcarbamoyladenosine dehydratase [Proteobacteria bacterium]|nr:tRNA threonylcarbamoyladenosine dehydratase [Pseudomonadota bacterium]
MNDTRFLGIDRLYGKGSASRLATKNVAVIGLGGVGSWAAEALARSGVGGLTLLDGDEVCVSNVNRQSHALQDTLGRGKVDVLAERLRAINPDLRCQARAEFLVPAKIPALLDERHDLILDACDAFRVKLELIAACRRVRRPLVVVGSAGGRTDPTQVRVRDLSRTEHDKLLSLIRKKLRQDFGFPKRPERYFGIPAIYSLENVRYPQPDGSVCGLRPATDAAGRMRLDCGTGLGAAMHVTAAFACAAVARAIESLLKVAPAH